MPLINTNVVQMPQLAADDFFADLIATDNIPAQLKAIPNWLSWKLIEKNGKPTKEPFVCGTNRHASSTDSSTWSDFKTATKDVTLSATSGIGFVIHGAATEAGIVGVDLDGCRNPETGQLTEWATTVVDSLQSYTEITPSKAGIRVWVIGKRPAEAKYKFHLSPQAGFGSKVQIEIYDSARYFTVTGDKIGTVSDIQTRDLSTLFELCEQVKKQFPIAKESSAVSKYGNALATGIQFDLSGTAITTKLALLMSGKIVSQTPFKIEDEYDNSASAPSQSEVDMSLCNLLALDHDNADAIEAEFNKSPLSNRDKWTNRKDYRDRTIEKAIAWAATQKTETAENAAVEDEEIDVEEALPPFPRFPGLLSELADAICPDLPYEFKVMAAVTLWGVTRSGLDTIKGQENIQPRQYVCFIAPPDSGKSASITETTKYLSSVLKFHKILSVDSGPALVDEFADIEKSIPPETPDKEVRGILLPDELLDVFEKGKQTAQSKNTLLSELLKLYEGNQTANRSRKSGKRQVEHAHFAILGGATDKKYKQMWVGTGGAASGLQSRFTPITTTAGKLPFSPAPTAYERLPELLERLQRLAEQPGHVFELTPGAERVLAEWWSSRPRDKQADDRAKDIVKRLLIVLAATTNVEIIDEPLSKIGVQFGDYVIACREKFNPQDSYSWVQNFENMVIRIAERKKVPMTANDYRRATNPQREPGGVGSFLQAWKNVTMAGILIPDGKTHKGTVKYRLSRRGEQD